MSAPDDVMTRAHLLAERQALINLVADHHRENEQLRERLAQYEQALRQVASVLQATVDVLVYLPGCYNVVATLSDGILACERARGDSRAHR